MKRICPFGLAAFLIAGCDPRTEPVDLPLPNVQFAVSTTGVEIIEIGTLGGDSKAFDVNASGQVVGLASLPTRGTRAFLWDQGVTKDLGTLGGDAAYAVGINDRGQIVGASTTADGPDYHACLWEDGAISDLGTLGGRYTKATAINDSGQVVLYGVDGAFLWENGALTDLGTLGSSKTAAWDVNNRGQVAGYSRIGNDFHAFLWENGVMADLGTFRGEASQGWDINDRGQVVGVVLHSLSARPFVWEKRGWWRRDMTDLDPDNQEISAIANGNNNKGQIVGETLRGSSPIPGGHAFLWEDGAMIDLGMLSAGDHRAVANAINDQGLVVGWVIKPNYVDAAVIWRVGHSSGEN